MVLVELVRRVNNNLRLLKIQAETHGESSIVIAMLDNLIELTNADSAAEAEYVDSGDADDVEQAGTANPTFADLGNCPHTFLNIYGKCLRCGQCQHTQVGNAGTCNTCGQSVQKSA